MKYHISLLLSLFLSWMAAATASAQLAVGDWRFYPAFQGGGTSRIVATPSSKIYFLSGINLFSYDPSTQESVSYSKENVLSDVKVEDIFYHPDKRCLAVVYTGGNIDLIDKDGDVANVSAIADASIPGDREVRSVAFYDNRMFVGTDFGLVVINVDNHKVIESGQYRGISSTGAKVPSGGPDQMTRLGDRLVALFGTDLYESYPDDRTTTYREAEKFKYIGKLTSLQLIGLDDNTLVSRRKQGSGYAVDKVAFPATVAGGNVQYQTLGSGIVSDIWRDSGTLYAMTSTALSEITPAGITVKQTMPSEIATFNGVTSAGATARTWFGTPDGLICYDMTASPAAVAYPYHKPLANSVYNVSWIIPSRDGNRIYVSTRGSSYDILSASGNAAEPLQKEMGRTTRFGYLTPGFIDVIENLEVRPVNYRTEQLNGNGGTGYGETQVVEGRYGKVIAGMMSVAENPANPGELWVASLNEGLYKIEGGRTTALFGGRLKEVVPENPILDNMPAPGMLRQLLHDVKFDREGNLWVLADNHDAVTVDKNQIEGTQLMMLPARMVNSDPSRITKDDWISEKDGESLIPNNFNMNFDGRILMMEHRNTMVIMPSKYNGYMLLYRHKGTLGDVSDDEYLPIYNVVDQDGNVITANLNTTTLFEDNKGNLIVGNIEAFYMIKDPDTFNPDTDRVHRFKVARDDGSGTADYMLNSVIISDISQDAAGRLWVATEGSGISVINADYTDIEQQFTMDNSPLPTDNISALIVDPTSNRVYFGTRFGLGEFASDQSPAMDTYDEVRAYPNPVRPGYKGVITIDGLMDDSLVKITDAMGNVVWSGLSTGGMVTWDGRDHNDIRPRSGVYYVMASQRADGGDKGSIVCKILFIR